MNTTCDSIIPLLQADFGKLWNCKPRGNSVEVITPFSTATEKFVSVFITSRNGEFIVTDAGWLEGDDNPYGIPSDPDETEYEAILRHYMAQFRISNHEDKSRNFYIRRASSPEFLSSAVYDLANFIVSVVNWASLPGEASVEAEHRKTFRRKANEFVKLALPRTTDARLKLNYRLEGLPVARFNVAVQYTSKLSLIVYVTGSSSTRFLTDFKKGIVNFELTERSRYADFIRKRVALINDEADGFDDYKNRELYQLLAKHNGHALRWSDRDAISEFV